MDRIETMEYGDYEYAVASDLAYQYLDNNENAEETQEILGQRLPDYKIIKALSNKDAITIERDTGSAIIAYRGTDPNIFKHGTDSLRDLRADAQVLLGAHRGEGNSIFGGQTRFHEAEELYKKVAEQYDRVDLTGHSLGSSATIYVSQKYDVPAVVFNPGETPLEYLRFDRNVKPSQIRVYTTGTDIISKHTDAYKNFQEIIKIEQTDFAPIVGSHNLANFMPTSDMYPLKIKNKPFAESLEFNQKTNFNPIRRTINKSNINKINFYKDDNLNERFNRSFCESQPYYSDICKKLNKKL
tara:strand:+ start:436 stop:1329 length:894 start_codon:yes stop_codon:yes gene_type:complete